ncbi:phage regulatory CII family protein [Vibrio splendidus]|uniref:Uncharacterized protein n=1 Tax=Vibrio splendidus TaxID=29497 RepID=A0A7Y4DBU1_VIBSP|nr:phage regulatory CII family protein [Vibrio splendidus]NOJ15491.1 hypothetical protein [Vibrio splendidus]
MKNEEIDQFLGALHAHCKSVGIEEIFRKVSSYYKEKNDKAIKPSTFQNKINAHRGEHKLNIEEFIYVLLVLKQEDSHTVVLQDFLALFGFRLEYISEITEYCDFDHKSFMEAWMNFNKEHGDVQIALSSALSDYKITTNELNNIKKELAEQIEAMTKLRFALDNVCGKQLA